jgi:hypothetical protein
LHETEHQAPADCENNRSAGGRMKFPQIFLKEFARTVVSMNASVGTVLTRNNTKHA